MNIVFKVSDNVKDKMIKYYMDKRKEKTPPYAIFQAVEEDTVITLYESGKAMFQGTSADIDANIWIDMEKHLNNKTIDITSPSPKKDDKKNTPELQFNMSTIGSDEVGTGDYFGPIIVTASYVSKENIPFMLDLGVRDSKKITDDKIKAIAPQIIKKIPYVTIILNNEKYNENYSEDINMNKIKSLLHNRAIVTLLKKDNYDYQKIVIDQFVYPKKYYEHISNSKEKAKNITFTTKAEDKCLSVAASSVISRYLFLQKIEEMKKETGMDIPKGAGLEVDKAAANIVKEFGLNKLKSLVKLNFKNTKKVLQIIKEDNSCN